jgi:hypothetical protein
LFSIPHITFLRCLLHKLPTYFYNIWLCDGS